MGHAHRQEAQPTQTGSSPIEFRSSFTGFRFRATSAKLSFFIRFLRALLWRVSLSFYLDPKLRELLRRILFDQVSPNWSSKALSLHRVLSIVADLNDRKLFLSLVGIGKLDSSEVGAILELTNGPVGALFFFYRAPSRRNWAGPRPTIWSWARASPAAWYLTCSSTRSKRFCTGESPQAFFYFYFIYRRSASTDFEKHDQKKRIPFFFILMKTDYARYVFSWYRQQCITRLIITFRCFYFWNLFDWFVWRQWNDFYRSSVYFFCQISPPDWFDRLLNT